MRQFFVETEGVDAARGLAWLRDAETVHHLRSVLKLAAGEAVILADGTGRRWKAALSEAGKREALFSLEAELPAPPACRPVCAAVGLARGGAFEEALDAATQLGATELVPLLTARSQVKVPADEAPAKMARWQRIVREAGQQCNRATLPRVLAPCTTGAAPALFGARRVLLAWEGGGMPMARALRGVPPADGVMILVGPEGGFDPGEASALLAAGAQAVTLGPTILRTPVAVAAMLAGIQYLSEENQA